MNNETTPKKKKFRLEITLRQFLLMAAADLLFAVGLNCFYVDNQIAAGGFSGVATVINYFIPVPIGITVFVMNIPLLIASWKIKGGSYTIMTLVTTVLYSLIVDLLSFLPCVTYDKLVAVVCGGLLYGFGASLTLKAHLSSGSTDLLAKLLITKFKNMSIGTMFMIVDGAIVLMATIAFRDLSAGIYALLAIAACSVITDIMNKGFNKAQMFLIFANHNQEEISDAILSEIHHGVTVLRGTGKYSNNDRDILLTVVHPGQTAQLKDIVHRLDPDAFVILVSANEIVGEGFETTNLTATVRDRR